MGASGERGVPERAFVPEDAIFVSDIMFVFQINLDYSH